MQVEVGTLNMRVLINILDTACVEGGRPPFETMNLIALFEQELRQISPVLPGDASD